MLAHKYRLHNTVTIVHVVVVVVVVLVYLHDRYSSDKLVI